MEFPTLDGDSQRTAEVVGSLPLVADGDRTGLRAAFGVALHMHQPTVIGAGDRTTAPLISTTRATCFGG